MGRAMILMCNNLNYNNFCINSTQKDEFSCPTYSAYYEAIHISLFRFVLCPILTGPP